MLAGLFPAAVGTALAQTPADTARDFPNRAIKIVVPFPAGGPTDINARIIAQRMAEDWKQPVVIENRPRREAVRWNRAFKDSGSKLE